MTRRNITFVAVVLVFLLAALAGCKKEETGPIKPPAGAQNAAPANTQGAPTTHD